MSGTGRLRGTLHTSDWLSPMEYSLERKVSANCRKCQLDKNFCNSGIVVATVELSLRQWNCCNDNSTVANASWKKQTSRASRKLNHVHTSDWRSPME